MEILEQINEQIYRADLKNIPSRYKQASLREIKSKGEAPDKFNFNR